MLNDTANATPPLLLDSRLGSVQLLSARQLSEALRISERTIWRRVARTEAEIDDFPLPIRLAARTLRWRLSDIAAYLTRLERGGRAVQA